MHWRLSDCQTAAPDRETVRCTLAIVWFPESWGLNGCLIAKVRCSRNATSFAMKSEERKLVADATSFAMMSRFLHPMLRPSDALTILSVFPECWGSTVVCWRRRGVWCLLKLLADWLTARQAVDWWMTQARRQMLAFIDCERFFSSTGDFSFAFSDVFRAVNAVFRWLGYSSCRARWIWLVCGDTSTFDRSSESMIFRINVSWENSNLAVSSQRTS